MVEEQEAKQEAVEEEKEEKTEEAPKEEEVKEEPAEEAKEEETEEVKEAPKKEKKKGPKASVSDEKKQLVKELAEKLKNNKTIMLLSIRNLPSPQFQKIKKQLREKAEVKVAKKSIVSRAIETAGVAEMQELVSHIEGDMAIAFSNDDAFELCAWLSNNRNPIGAKVGQEATDDIKVEPGPTEMVPGPDISTLGSVGLQIAVEEGKLAIKEPATILKAGEVIDENMASVLTKLDIKPFMIGLNPAVIYDGEAKKIYVGVKIDKDEALAELLLGQSKGLGLAQKLEIITSDTIGYMIAKANMQAMSLEKLSPSEEAPKEEEKAEEAKEEAAEKVKEEKKEEAPTEEAKEEEKKEETTDETKSEEEKK